MDQKKSNTPHCSEIPGMGVQTSKGLGMGLLPQPSPIVATVVPSEQHCREIRVIETESFTLDAAKLLSDEDRLTVFHKLAADPTAGEVYYQHKNISLKIYTCFGLRFLFVDLRSEGEILMVGVSTDDGQGPTPPGNKDKRILNRIIEKVVLAISVSGVKELISILIDTFSRSRDIQKLSLFNNNIDVDNYDYDISKFIQRIYASPNFYKKARVNRCNAMLTNSRINQQPRLKRSSRKLTMNRRFFPIFGAPIVQQLSSHTAHNLQAVVDSGSRCTSLQHSWMLNYWETRCSNMSMRIARRQNRFGVTPEDICMATSYYVVGTHRCNEKDLVMKQTSLEVRDQFASALLNYADHKTGKRKMMETSVHIPVANVRAIRSGLSLSQREFAEKFGLSLSSVRNWEQGVREPEQPISLLLHLIEKLPDQVASEVSRLKITR